MAHRPRRSQQANRPSARGEDFTALTSEVLKLRLQALNLPIVGSRGQLLARLKRALPGKATTAPNPRKRRTTTVKTRQFGRPKKKSATNRTAGEPATRPASPVDEDEDSALSDNASFSSIEEMIESGPEPVAFGSQSTTVFSPDQRSAIEDLVSESIRSALSTFQTSSAAHPPSSPNENCCTPGMASPLGLSRPLDQSLEDKIRRGDRGDPKRCASISTSLPVADAVTAATRTYAAAAIPPTTPPQTAPSNSPTTPAGPLNPVNVARNKVEQQRCNQRPLVSSPIDIYRLELELTHHPDRNFVNHLLSTLKEGARIGYSGPRSSRVSPNLISAAQHPDVVSFNLHKEIALGRVAGPYPSPPLPKFQCHPVGVIPKKHSTEWRTIYHLSYPLGASINDHIPKDPYSLSYVRVDDAIHILQSLGRGAFMAKTDLKSAFRLIPIHPDDWHLLGIHWQSQYYVDMYLPFGLRSAPFLFNQLSDGLEWILKNNYGIQHAIHILDDFFIAERSKLACLTNFSTLLRVFMSLKAPVVASKTMGPSQEI